MSCDTLCDMLSTKEAHQRLSVQGFCWELVTQTPCGMCQISRLQEGKQVFSIDDVVCTVYIQ